MTIQERDYMRSDGGRPGKPLKFPELVSRAWWRRIKMRNALNVAALLIAVSSGAIWLARDTAGLFASFGPGEGSLVVNINTATTEELETLPGIGPALAQLIVQSPPYPSIDDLKRVRGIGPGLITSLRPFIKTEGDTGSMPAH